MTLIDTIGATLGSADYDYLMGSVLIEMSEECSISKQDEIEQQIISLKDEISKVYEDRETLNFEKTRIDRIIKELESTSLEPDMRLFILLMVEKSADIQDKLGLMSPAPLVEAKSKLSQRLSTLKARWSCLASLNERSFRIGSITIDDIEKALEPLNKRTNRR